MTQEGVTTYRFFRDGSRHAIVLTGSVLRATFRTLSDDDLFYSRFWGLCRGKCLWMVYRERREFLILGCCIRNELNLEISSMVNNNFGKKL